MTRTNRAGFTLIEVLLVVTIIGILTAVLYTNFNDARAQSRDVERQSNLRTLQSAIELYKNRHGQYPEGCNGPNTWSGQPGTNYACSDGTARYIVGDPASSRGFVPDFVPILPLDRKLPASDPTSGYVYQTNADGTVYKLMALDTVEQDSLDYNHEFKRCDFYGSADPSQLCLQVPPSNNVPNRCLDGNGNFENTYAVWGGFANGATDIQVAAQTKAIVCD